MKPNIRELAKYTNKLVINTLALHGESIYEPLPLNYGWEKIQLMSQGFWRNWLVFQKSLIWIFLLLGRVDLCCTNFGLNGSVLIANQLCRPSGLSQRAVTKSKMLP